MILLRTFLTLTITLGFGLFISAVPTSLQGQTMVPLRDAPAAMMGQQLGQVGRSAIDLRNLALERQRTVVEARRRLQQCGQCPDRGRLQQQLTELENADSRTREVIDNMEFRYGSSGLSAVLRQLNDPLGLQRAAQTKRARVINLRRSYCYAVTDTPEQENGCNTSLTFQDFDENERDVANRCESAVDKAKCFADGGFVPEMNRAIRDACGFGTAPIPEEWPTLVTRCNHRTKPKPAEQAGSIVLSFDVFNSAYGGLSTGLQGRMLQFNPTSFLRHWSNAGIYKMLVCYYNVDGISTKMTFWHGEVPAGYSDLAQRVISVVPANVEEIGIWNMGAGTQANCPATYSEARETRAKLRADRILTVPGSLIASHEVRSGVYLGGIVADGRPVSGPQALRYERLQSTILANPANRMITCTYGPVVMDMAAPGDGFGFMEYFAWFETLPAEWPELLSLMNRSPPRRAASISNRPLKDCPPTLDEARRRAEVMGESGPVSRR